MFHGFLKTPSRVAAARGGRSPPDSISNPESPGRRRDGARRSVVRFSGAFCRAEAEKA